MYIINEKIEDVLDEGSVADRIIKQIYDLKPDTEIREHSAYITDHDWKLKEIGGSNKVLFPHLHISNKNL
jgi:hypothetical protein